MERFVEKVSELLGLRIDHLTREEAAQLLVQRDVRFVWRPYIAERPPTVGDSLDACLQERRVFPCS